MLRRNAPRIASSALNVLQQAVQQQQCGWLSGCTQLGSASLCTHHVSQLQGNYNNTLGWPVWSSYTTTGTAAAATPAAAEAAATETTQVAEPEVDSSSSSSSRTRTRIRNNIVTTTSSSRRRSRAGAAPEETQEADKQAADEVYSLLLGAGLNTQQLLKLVQVYPGGSVSPADYSTTIREALALQQQLPHLSLADLLARHPKILQIYNPQGIVDRLHHCQRLLHRKGGLSEGDAWSWLGRCRSLEKVLQGADHMVQLMQEKSRAYEEVLGCPASPKFFWRTSHRSKTPAEDLRARLQQLLGLWGDAGQLHKALESHNSLLNSDPDTVETKWLLHMENFGLTQEEMRKVVSKWPRFVVTRPELLMERAQQLQQRLKLPEGTGIKPLLLSFPQILGNKGANISTKLAKLQEMFSLDDAGLAELVMNQPSLCGSATETVEARAEIIQRLLGLSDQQLQHMLRQNRAAPILTLAASTLEQRIPQLIQLLGWPLDRLARIFIRQPTLICYPPATLERNIQQIAQAAGLSKADTLQVLLHDPVVLQLKPDKVVACMQRVRQLMALHPPWAAHLSGDLVAAGQHVLRVTARVGQRTANRMEFLLATGRADEVSLHQLRNVNNATWDNMYPEYQVWLQARQDMQQQQQQQQRDQEEGQGAATMQG